jgi:RimJ/RimL family protein N-acetyltransferase
MDNPLLMGNLVRLVAEDPKNAPEVLAQWDRDTEYTRLLEIHPVRLRGLSEVRRSLEQDLTNRSFFFAIQALADNQMIGFIGVFRVRYHHGDCMVGIGIGDPQYRGKGYGTEAMQLLLRFAFQELNMHRVSLMAVAGNARAIRSYEKSEFVLEGRQRGADHRMGIRQDVVCMGILRAEWETRQSRADQRES